MIRKSAAIIGACVIAFAFTACSGKPPLKNKAVPGKISVAVTFDAMKEFTEVVGGDKVSITTMVPDGTEPHDFEPKTHDLEMMSDARIFVYNGLGMENWVDQAIQAIGNPKLLVVEASKGAKAITYSDGKSIQEHGRADPHLWLSMKGAENGVRNIRDALVKADPKSRDYYERNCRNFIGKLENLSNEYTVKFKSAPNKNFVTGHAAFAYFCRDFGLTQHSVEDVFAEGEPSARQLRQLADFCKRERVKTVFVEDMVSPAVSRTLAAQVGAKVKKIYTVESSEDGKTYLARMQDNLAVVYESLNS